MARAEDILAIARKEIGTVEQPGNRQKYGKAYGVDGRTRLAGWNQNQRKGRMT